MLASQTLLACLCVHEGRRSYASPRVQQNQEWVYRVLDVEHGCCTLAIDPLPPYILYIYYILKKKKNKKWTFFHDNLPSLLRQEFQDKIVEKCRRVMSVDNDSERKSPELEAVLVKVRYCDRFLLQLTHRSTVPPSSTLPPPNPPSLPPCFNIFPLVIHSSYFSSLPRFPFSLVSRSCGERPFPVLSPLTALCPSTPEPSKGKVGPFRTYS